MRLSHCRGFTLLELLLSLAIFTAMLLFINRFLRRVSDQSQSGLVSAQNSYCRNKILRQVEVDIYGQKPQHFESLGDNGFSWRSANGKNSEGAGRCVYYYDPVEKCLYRQRLNADEIFSEIPPQSRYLLATGIAIFTGELKFSEKENRHYFLIKIAANRDGRTYQTRFWLDAIPNGP